MIYELVVPQFTKMLGNLLAVLDESAKYAGEKKFDVGVLLQSRLAPDQFNLMQSIDLLLLIVIGGLGSVHGVFLGAIFLIILPQGISAGKEFLPEFIGQAPGLKSVIYGSVLIAFVLFEPMGLYGRWLKVRTYLQMFPFYRKGMFKRQKSFQKSDRLK